MPIAFNANSIRPDLLRELGPAHAASIVIGVVIGSGIFLVPSEMMQAAGSARLVYLAWIIGGIFSFFGAVTYAQLGAMKPQAGGEYVYIRDAYGPLAGFLCGWTWTVVVKPSSLAAISTGVIRILANYPPLAFLNVHAISLGRFFLTWGQLVAIAFVFLISAVNYVGIRRAGNFQLAFTVLKLVLIVAIAAIAFTAPGDWRHFAQNYPGATGGLTGFFAALAAALWAYDGWSDLNMVAEEIRDPERNIPLAMIGGHFRLLFSLALFAEWLAYVTASSALFVFHSKGYALNRQFHIWRYPLAPALFIVASGALLYYTFISNLRYSALGTLVILAGIPVYFAFALRRTV